MDALKKMFLSFGLKEVKTYIQSGNVIFESAESNSVKLRKSIEKKLGQALGYEVAVILRTQAEMEVLVKLDPFKAFKPNAEEKMYVVLLCEEPQNKPKIPLLSAKEDVEVFQMSKLDALCISRKKNGNFGFPNALIEKEMKVAATTRNWNTIIKILALAQI